VEGVDEVTECEGKILVEEIANVLARADVRPAAVNEQQSLEK